MQTVTNQQKLKPWMGFVLFAVLMAAFIFVCVPMQTANSILGLVGTELLFLVMAILYGLIFKIPLKEMFPIKKFTAKDLFGSFFLVIGGSFFGLISVGVVGALFPSTVEAGDVEGLFDIITGGPGFLLLIVIIALLPAICEEAIHRGAILSNFRSLKKDWVIVLIMGIFFGINHCSVLRFASTAILGAALSYVLVKKNNIILTMFMHFANNFVSANAGYFSNAAGADTSVAPDIGSYLGVYLLLGFAAPVFIVLGMMLLNGKSHKKIRFLYAGIISAVMLITGIGMTVNLAMHSAAFAKRQILNSTIGYTVTKAGTSDTDLSFDIEKDTSATISVNVKNAEGDYKIVIDGDKGSSVINAEVPAGDPRKITYNVALQPDHYRIKVDAGENAVGEKPLFDFLVN